MTDKSWLTPELDQTPFFYDEADFEEYVKNSNIEKKKAFIAEKFKNPKILEAVYSAKERKIRFIKAATSFLTLEGEDVSFPLATESEKLSLDDYYQACVKAYEYSKEPYFYPSQKEMIALNSILLAHDEETANYPKYILRNESFPSIVIGKGYFQPIPGDQVNDRTSLMLYNLVGPWFNDPIFVKGAKFVTEYVRVQPHMAGNKRTALMLLNAMLQSNGYPSIYFDKSRIDALHSCIEESMLTRNVTNFSKLIVDSINKHYDHIIQNIETYEASKSIEEVERKMSSNNATPNK